ncbi:MAG: hypothetical protein KDD70_06670 [Bdellovibrionales bacterium]|nr:hypothetical protein [Bdellovibrionales bacterium]
METEEFPEWFRIGDENFILGVYPEEKHSRDWPLRENVRILYGDVGVSVYFPDEASLSDEVRGIIEKCLELRDLSELWAELRALRDCHQLNEKEEMAFEVARQLLAAGEDPLLLNYGLGVTQATLFYHQIRALSRNNGTK